MEALSESTKASGLPPAQPALLTLAMVAVGIALDRRWSAAWEMWLTVAAASLLGWLLLHRRRRDRVASLAVLACAMATGGLWQHVWWNLYGANDIAVYASEIARPARLRGVMIREPRWLAAPQPDPFEPTPSGVRTRLALRVEAIQNGSRFEPATGTLPAWVDGQLSGFAAGDLVEVIGELKWRARPNNPGEFDFREFARSEREVCSLSVHQPGAVRLIERRSRWGLIRFWSVLRQRCDRLIWNTLDGPNAALASGILLGIREQLDESEKLDYLMTGTVHLLAISGLHVGILAGGVLTLGSLGLIGRRKSLWLTLGFVVFYAGLVEFQPTVVRAAALVIVWCASRLIGRAGFSLNSLAFAGLVVLAMNPSALFHVGAQLSFLAVATLSTTHRYFFGRREADPLEQLVQQSRSWQERLVREGMTRICRAFGVSAMVWLLALPLVAAQFHVVAPIALVVNPLLMIPIALALLSGFLFVLFGGWLPIGGDLIGWVFGWSLSAIRGIVGLGSEVPGGCWWTVGPADWFVAAFYVTAIFVYAFPATRLPARWGFSLTVLTLASGWFLPSALELRGQRERRDLEVVFADVGHGGCALIKLPGGQTVVFDAGSTSSPSSTARTISEVLWYERVYHLDALIISHADLDHFCAADRLSELFSIGAVYLPQSMATQLDSPAAELIRSFRDKRIPIRLTRSGQAVSPPAGAILEVLHPSAGTVYSSDNAGSIVCDVMFGRESILLTGDVEREGLEALLRQPSRSRFVAVAPHHGSASNDPARFVPWSRAENIVICNAWDPMKAVELAVFAHAGGRVWITGRDGAVRIHLSPDGRCRLIQAWHERPW
jgi:competence protein ComEC